MYPDNVLLYPFPSAGTRFVCMLLDRCMGVVLRNITSEEAGSASFRGGI